MAAQIDEHLTEIEPGRALRGFTTIDAPSPDILNNCVRCGLCLTACPTWGETKLETSSPRGRITLMRAVAEGKLDVSSPVFVHQMYECLDCRACEKVCPSGVQYGKLVEPARGASREAACRAVPLATRRTQRRSSRGCSATWPSSARGSHFFKVYQRAACSGWCGRAAC